MADRRLDELTTAESISGTDIVYIVRDPGGTPLPRKATITALATAVGGGGGAVTSVNGNVGVVVLTATSVGADAAGTAAAAVAAIPSNAAAGTPSLRSLSTTSTTACAGNDSRLSDTRTPTAHAASHASAGSDPVTIAESQVTNLTSDLALKAPLASPTFTGTPLSTTAAPGTNTTQIATTAYATAADAALILDSIADSDTTHAPSRNAVFDALALKAPLASPALTGTPTAPTQTAGNNSTRLATTAYADALVADAINDSVTGIAPSQNAVFDALALKQTKSTFPVVIGVALSDETTAITTGTDKCKLRAPFAFTLTAVRASLATVSSSGLPTVDINKNGTTVLSTKLSIDASEATSQTAATPAVISVSAFADDDSIEFDIDVAGTGAKGLKVWLIGTRVAP